MRVSALLYVAKKECFSRAEINDVERFYPKKSEKRQETSIDDVGRVMFLL